MKKITLIIVSITSFAFISAIMKDDGRAGATGSPGETNCNTSQCHNGNTVNSAGGSIVIAAATMPGWQYVPGQVYPISVTVAKTGVSLFGLGFEALRSTGANGGLLSITTPSETQIKTASVGGNARTNIVHQLNGGATLGSHTFTFNWTAPVTGTGAVTFYAAGNAANGTGTSSGDFIYTASQVVTEMTAGLEDLSENGSMQVYPNPVTDKFNIRFKINEPAFVEIKMLDTRGRAIAEIVSLPLVAGEQDFQYEPAASLSPGVYFLHLTIDEKQVVKRIAVL